MLLAIHGQHPSGALRPTKFVPDEFVSLREKGHLYQAWCKTTHTTCFNNSVYPSPKGNGFTYLLSETLNILPCLGHAGAPLDAHEGKDAAVDLADDLPLDALHPDAGEFGRQGIGICGDIPTVADLFDRMMGQAEASLGRFASCGQLAGGDAHRSKGTL